MQESTRRETVAQAADEGIRKDAFGGADGFGVPFRRFEIEGRDEGRLAAHGQAHVALAQGCVHFFAQAVQFRPCRIREGFGDARMFGHAGHGHVEIEGHIGRAGEARDGGCVAVMRRGGQRHMGFPRQKARCGVKPNPAGAGQIDLGPGVQIGEVMGGPHGTIDGDQIGLQLDEVARDEARGKAQMAQRLHQKPACVAAGALGQFQCLFRGLHARFQPDDIADLLRKPGVQADDHIDGAHGIARDSGQPCLQQRPGGFGGAVDHQILGHILGVGEGPGIGRFLDKEIERVVDGHVSGQIDLDLQLAHGLGKDIAGQPVAVRVLLVVHEVIGRADLQRVRHDPCPTMRRRAQADDLRSKADRAVILVMGQVMNAGKDGHGHLWGQGCPLVFSQPPLSYHHKLRGGPD